jgi:hypothetical protein
VGEFLELHQGPQSLVGRHLLIDNANERDATYPIVSAEKDGELTKVFCGPITFVRGYAGPTTTVRTKALPRSYDQGFTYDFEEGATFLGRSQVGKAAGATKPSSSSPSSQGSSSSGGARP